MARKEVISDWAKKDQEIIEYVSQTDLCFDCKKNPIVAGQHRCKPCSDQVYDILKQLNGTGFIGVGLRKRSHD